MDLTEGSETSANINQAPGKHPKVDTLNTEHGKSLKSRSIFLFTVIIIIIIAIVPWEMCQAIGS
jgi:accessory gene regulator protein AgrB